MSAFKSTLLCAAVLVASVSAQSSFTFVAPGAAATATRSGAAPQATGSATGCVDEVLVASTANGSAAIAEGWDNAKTTFTAPANWAVTLPTTGGYVAIHFNEQKCRDLSKYQGVSFDVASPASGAFNIAWTPRNPDCTQIANAEKTYLPAAKYVQGTQVVIPFSDFKNVGFSSIEDLTLIDFKPATSGWRISNITLRCTLNKAAASGVPTPGAAAPASGTSANSSAGANSGAVKASAAGAVAAVAVGAAALLI